MRRPLQLGLLLAIGVLSAGPLRASATLVAVKEQFDAGRYQEAVGALQAALRQNPRDAQLHFWLERCYLELRDWDSAIRAGQQAVQLDSGNSEFHYWLGEAYGARADDQRSLGDARKARQAYEAAVQRDPRNLRARRALMEYLVRAPWIAGGSKSKAREQLEAIAALDPLEGHLARGRYWWLEEKWDLAQAEYRRVLELKPAGVEPYLDVADFYRKRRDAAGLRAALDGAARVHPGEPRLAYFRGVMHVLAGDRLDEAERQLQLYLRGAPRHHSPSHASALEWLGKLYERQGKCREAAESYRRALRLNRDLKDAGEGLKRLKC